MVSKLEMLGRLLQCILELKSDCVYNYMQNEGIL